MRPQAVHILLGSFVAAVLAFVPTPAHAASPFRIAATDVTMSTNGNGQTSYTVTAIPSSGSLIISCQYSGPTTTAHLPVCELGPLISWQVTAGQTLTSSITFYPYGTIVPGTASAHRPSPATPVLFAGLLAAAILFRRRLPAALLRVILVAAGIASLAALSACGGSSGPTTPGTYAFTIAANNEANPNTPLGQGVTTTIHVTVQ